MVRNGSRKPVGILPRVPHRWLSVRARNRPQLLHPLKQYTPSSAMYALPPRSLANDTIWTITRPHYQLFTFFCYFMFLHTFLLCRVFLCTSKAHVAIS